MDEVEMNYDNMTLEELEEEKNDLLGAIRNEKLWMLGSKDKESKRIHMENMEALQEEAEYVINKIKNKKEK
jgi:hypothetical protein